MYISVWKISPNFRQQQLVLASDQPFSTYFDASLVWGPVISRMAYALSFGSKSSNYTEKGLGPFFIYSLFQWYSY